ncbi:unnamed protein product [Arctogadus glacialis]
MFQEAAARWMLSQRGFEGHAPTGGGLRSETLSDVEVLSTRDPPHPLWSPAAPGELRFYTFPKDVTQRELWLKNISRAGVSGCFNTFQPTTGHRVCSVHFSGGRKTYNIRVPTQFPLRGVNERKHRRGRGRGKKGSAAVAAAQPRTAAHPGIVISNVYSTSPGDADSNTTAETEQPGQIYGTNPK